MLLDVLLQLLLANCLANIIIGVHILIDVVVFAKDLLGTGFVACTVYSLFEVRHDKLLAFLCKRQTTSMIAT